jgi:hypothetical protein
MHPFARLLRDSRQHRALAAALVAVVAVITAVAATCDPRGLNDEAAPSPDADAVAGIPTPIPPGTTYLALDLNIANGVAPCDIIDDEITVNGGDEVRIAVCAVSLRESPLTFRFDVRYDDTIVSVPEVADDGPGTDDNPDANAGATTYGTTNLGPNWICVGGGRSYPTGDKEPASGPNNGVAFSGACNGTGELTLGSEGVLSVISIDAISPGVTSVAIAEASLIDNQLALLADCLLLSTPCLGGTITVVGEAGATSTPTIIATPTTSAATATPNPDLSPGVYLDFDMTNGAHPCDVIDASTTVAVGESVQVAVCQINMTGMTAGFGYWLRYDDTVIVAPEVADDGLGLDDNPDANAGATTFGPTNLGPTWDCSAGVGSYPKGDKNPEIGVGNGEAYSGGCSSAAGPYPLGDSGVLGVVTFTGIAPGTSSVTVDVETANDALNVFGCMPHFVLVACVGGTVHVQ